MLFAMNVRAVPFVLVSESFSLHSVEPIKAISGTKARAWLASDVSDVGLPAQYQELFFAAVGSVILVMIE
jgi:hypothetical protein